MKLAKFYAKYYLFRSTHKVCNIEEVIESQGFEIFRFDPREENGKTAQFLELCGCKEYSKARPSFIYISDDDEKYVFIQKNLSYDDQIRYLFHEEAHIWYNHPNMTGFIENSRGHQNDIANHFLLKLRILKTITVLLIIALLTAGVFFLSPKPSRNVAEPDPIVDVPIIETPPQADEPPAQAEETVYITNSGDCYHRESCGTITLSEYITSTTRTKAEETGHRPCSYCKP